MQSRERWYNHLDPAINKGPWTRAKDGAIVAAYEEMGIKWARIAKAARERPDGQRHQETVEPHAPGG